MTNARSKTRTYAYTNRGDVYTLTMPDSTVETWSHDGTGNVTAYENQLGDTINYTFDDAGRETGIDYPTGTDPTFGYDNADRQTSMVDSTGTYSWTYDAADEATALGTPQGNLSYTYNTDGARHTMVEGVGTTTYAYDADGRLTSLANPYSETTSWTYDDADRCTRQTFGSGAYTAYGYDSRNRLTSLDHKTSANVAISSESYNYDSASNMTGKTVDSVATTYGYDAADQLTSESRTGYSASYTYDANGNRATKTLGGITDTYHLNDVDELTSITRAGWLTPVKSYTYDNAGRTTAVTTSVGTTSLTYDVEGRLTQITYPSTATNTFTYNALDTRVGKVDSAGTATYKRDGVDVTDPVLSDGAAGFTPGISERRSSATKYLHEDFLGSTTRLTDASQATTDTRQYDAFGNVVSTSGSNPLPFAFAGGWGYQTDSDSGLQLLGHRYYDSSTGRFLTRDPARDGRNWYGYCRNHPTRSVDPTGRMVEDEPEVVAELAWLAGDEAAGIESLGRSGLSRLSLFGELGKQIVAILTSLGLVVSSGTGADPGDPSPPRGRPIYRVVEPPEVASLHRNGGLLSPSPTGQGCKPFWPTYRQAVSYQEKIGSTNWAGGPTEIWVWPNPSGIGAIGPEVDSNGPTWTVPNAHLPLVGPGVHVPEVR